MNRYALSLLNQSFEPGALDGQHSTNIQYAIETIQSKAQQYFLSDPNTHNHNAESNREYNCTPLADK